MTPGMVNSNGFWPKTEESEERMGIAILMVATLDANSVDQITIDVIEKNHDQNRKI